MVQGIMVEEADNRTEAIGGVINQNFSTHTNNSSIISSHEVIKDYNIADEMKLGTSGDLKEQAFPEVKWSDKIVTFPVTCEIREGCNSQDDNNRVLTFISLMNRRNSLNIDQANSNSLDVCIKPNSGDAGKVNTIQLRSLGGTKQSRSEVCTNDVPHGRFIASFGGAGYLPPALCDCELPIEKGKGRAGCWVTKNLLLLGIALMVHYIAMKGAVNLQSSVNAEGGLGTASLTAYNAAFLFSNIFLAAVIVRWLGCKCTLALSILAYMPYIAAQFYASFYTLIPGGILAGLAAGPLWVAQGTYLSHISNTYSERTGVAKDVLMVRCFGIFYMLYQMSQVWGNLISSAVLSHGDSGLEVLMEHNGTGEVCGANFCPESQLSLGNLKLESPPLEKIYVITTIYLVCMAVACAIVVFGMDPLKRKEAKEESTQSGLHVLAATLRLLRCKEQLLLLPMTAWLGVEDAFLAADYTASYVSCAWGIRYIGYVMICYGVANSVSALIGGWIVKLTGRLPVVVSAMVLQVAIVATLLIWKPHPKDTIIFFAMAGLWGVTDGIWQAQINAMYGILFPGREEAAYSGFRLWEGVGYILAYGYSNTLCTGMKLYVLLGILILGISGYVAIELGIRSKDKSAS